jgi:RNA polymerase subunit RPABC4/transcription elongation factor Spt4
MSWCSACKKELGDSLETCPDCGGNLDEMTPDPELVTDAEWVIVAEKTGFITGHLILSALEQAEIPRTVLGGQFDTVKMYEGYDTRILVPKRCRDEAKEIVDAILNSANEEGLFCSNCGATVNDEAKVCSECGETFSPTPQKSE